MNYYSSETSILSRDFGQLNEILKLKQSISLALNTYLHLTFIHNKALCFTCTRFHVKFKLGSIKPYT